MYADAEEEEQNKKLQRASSRTNESVRDWKEARHMFQEAAFAEPAGHSPKETASSEKDLPGAQCPDPVLPGAHYPIQHDYRWNPNGRPTRPLDPTEINPLPYTPKGGKEDGNTPIAGILPQRHSPFQSFKPGDDPWDMPLPELPIRKAPPEDPPNKHGPCRHESTEGAQSGGPWDDHAPEALSHAPSASANTQNPGGAAAIVVERPSIKVDPTPRMQLDDSGLFFEEVSPGEPPSSRARKPPESGTKSPAAGDDELPHFLAELLGRSPQLSETGHPQLAGAPPNLANIKTTGEGSLLEAQSPFQQLPPVKTGTESSPTNAPGTSQTPPAQPTSRTAPITPPGRNFGAQIGHILRERSKEPGTPQGSPQPGTPRAGTPHPMSRAASAARLHRAESVTSRGLGSGGGSSRRHSGLGPPPKDPQNPLRRSQNDPDPIRPSPIPPLTPRTQGSRSPASSVRSESPSSGRAGDKALKVSDPPKSPNSDSGDPNQSNPPRAPSESCLEVALAAVKLTESPQPKGPEPPSVEIQSNSQGAMNGRLQGPAADFYLRYKGPSDEFWCDYCNVILSSDAAMNSHLQNPAHGFKVRETAVGWGKGLACRPELSLTSAQPAESREEGFYSHRDGPEHNMRAGIYTSSLPPSSQWRNVARAVVDKNEASLRRLKNGDAYLSYR